MVHSVIMAEMMQQLGMPHIGYMRQPFGDKKCKKRAGTIPTRFLYPNSAKIRFLQRRSCVQPLPQQLQPHRVHGDQTAWA